jgi:hypothetical protein
MSRASADRFYINTRGGVFMKIRLVSALAVAAAGSYLLEISNAPEWDISYSQ